tara:strand:- start:364 stop:648 length:285 start_codon:yes stop_codon:yes gene_type:complete
MINPFAQTLEEDFGIWWNMPKYKTRDIEARAYANNKIVKTNASNKDWPGPEKDVKYWVILDNSKCVGFMHGMSDAGKRRAKFAEFPVYDYSGKI